MKPALFLVVLLTLLLPVLGGCDDAFSPYTDGGGSFALYGVLDTDADSQVVRVEPLRQRPTTAAAPSFTLRSQGPEGVVEWSIREGRDAAGGPILLGVGVVSLRAGETHSLLVTGADGGTASVRAEVPEPLPLEGGEVSINADTSGVQQVLRLRNGNGQPDRVDVVYVVRADAAAAPVSVVRSYTTTSDNSARRIRVRLHADVAQARALAGVPPERPLLLDTTYVRYRFEQPAAVTDGFGEVRVRATLASAWALPDTLLPYLGLVRPTP